MQCLYAAATKITRRFPMVTGELYKEFSRGLQSDKAHKGQFELEILPRRIESTLVRKSQLINDLYSLKIRNFTLLLNLTIT